MLGKLPVPGRPTNLDIIGQGPTALAVGAHQVGVVWTFALTSYFASLGDSLTQTEILSQMVVKPKTTNQPTHC